jgi:uncharacterized protein (DUF983 family)
VAKEKLRVIVERGLRLRCPRCGVGRIFESVLRYREYPACPACGFVYDPKGESLIFMYLSTAGLTGVVGLLMVLTQPESPILSRVLLVGGALALYLTTMPTRKALAIAINYLHERA